MPKMTEWIEARCPWCRKIFKKRASDISGQSKPQRWIACSKACNLNLVKEESQISIELMQNRLSDNIVRRFQANAHKCSMISWNGYRYLRRPHHPAATQHGYVMEHRLVMEEVLGRILTKDEVVHHKNENKLDNRPDNLAIMTRSEHMKLHRRCG